ncbi:substrate-binding periplasmic protein [Spartinivicinus poritis]|uniref:Transporter substrate-binding domain-containing protein n=1 Tax=Spartinivicinus poritis TaxID=2994640 RepID=A0ABT5U2Z4_9GAMM|nr:transporter substrate-binding domain-containing protein [Spartinivicinus sp. A2-2]MDE1460734.1 transporter substrate-binding domain-containing protein [Spartinivicinus sp. A2-2]
MKRVIAWCWAVIAAASAHAEQPVTVFADDSYPPYSYFHEGKMKGIYTDILKEAFKEMSDYKVQIRPTPWKRGLKFLEQGVGFALYPPYLRKKARPFIGPYSVPILAEQLVVVCREEVFSNGPRADWPYDYIGLTIGRNSGFETFSVDFWRLVASDKIKVESAGGTRLNLLKVAKNRIPCYANDKLSIFWELKQMEKNGEYKPAEHGRIVEGVVISAEWGHVGYTNQGGGRFPFKDDFVMQLDIILKKMKSSGRINNIVERYAGTQAN